MDTLEMNAKSNDANDSQNRKLQKNESVKSAKEIVMEYFRAAERRDFKLARSYLSDNISYTGPLNSFDGAEPYFKYFQSLKLPPLDIKKAFADGNDLCLLYELHYGEPPMTIFACGWFQVNDDGKISSIRVVFDPRPFVQPGR
ncbi:MAG TPA: nuclear transport factor 2 family protein [Nitrososphaera sp.]|jgi:hypothetical protein|nr:nuclear transport factor 2 family protein [Nitrososphaera sp.]